MDDIASNYADYTDDEKMAMIANALRRVNLVVIAECIDDDWRLNRDTYDAKVIEMLAQEVTEVCVAVFNARAKEKRG